MKGQIKGQWSSWIKWIVALVILFLLLSSGKLDSLSKFSELKNKPLFVFTCLIVLLCNFLLNFRRWQLIVRDFQVSVSFKEAVSLSWIGQFFSIVLPGSVTGDLVKAVYLSKKEKNKRGNIFFSVVLDRFCGLAALLFLGCVFYFLAFVSGISNPQLDSLGLPISLLSIILFLSIIKL